MNELDIRPLLAAVPFKPFYLNLTDHGSYEVDKPDRLGFSASGKVVVYRCDDGSRVIIAMNHIVTITFPGSQDFLVIREQQS